MAAPLASAAREGLMATLGGEPFYKMSGSGNDFIFFDERGRDLSDLTRPDSVAALCARGTGVGADGLVVLEGLVAGTGSDVSIRYYNADGSRAALCGNATLCTIGLAVQLGAAVPSGFRINTGAGLVSARMRGGLPEFDLPPVVDAVAALSAIPVAPTEERLGFATAGVPHVVIRVTDLAGHDIVDRGRAVRSDPVLPDGANVSFVAPQTGGNAAWCLRTYERGVEGETLACGTGSVATAILLTMWGEASGPIALETRSGKVLSVKCTHDAATGAWRPTLRGEGRVVYTGTLVDR